MHRRTNEVSRIERVASVATATGVTVGTALLVLAALGPGVVRPWVAAPRRDARQVSEHLVYVAPPNAASAPVPVAAPRRRAARSSASTVPPPVTATTPGATGAADSSGPSHRVSARVADPGAASQPSVEALSPSHAKAGAPASGVASGGFRRPSSPIRVDSALRALSESLATRLATGRLKPPPPSQAEIDAKWRDQAFEVAASRASGVPVRQMGGGSISVPLPFGGPSRKQRERDRAIEAELKPMRALRQQRVDSVVAARQRRRADSLARVTESLRPHIRR